MILLKIILWLSIILVFHTYVGYPLILSFLTRKKERKIPNDEYVKDVTIIMSLHNEESVIAQKLDSVLHSNYPTENISILIGSDNSDDRTNQIVQEYAECYPCITFYPFTERRGKSNVINQLIKETQSDIVIFTDANVMFTRNTIRELVKGFANPDVGLVDSNMQNTGMKIDGISIQERAYISREVNIKNAEGILWGTMMGPFGGCFAMRKELYRTIPQDFMVDDFFLCMKVLSLGKRAINNTEAIVHEDVSNNLNDEFHRKIRIATGNFQNLVYFFPLIFSSRKGLSFSFISHKVLRWLTPCLFILYYISNLILLFNSTFYLILFVLFNLILLLIPLDFHLRKKNIHYSILRFITHFFSMNLALLIGMIHAIRDNANGIWEPTARNQ